MPADATAIRREIARRLIDSAKRWDNIGRLAIARRDAGGHDSRRMGRQMLAVASILRSDLHADILDPVFLRYIRNASATRILCAIMDRFPGGKLPGFSED